MPQQTNLNVAPYFDDFDAGNDFHKVLFKPGYPVQAREPRRCNQYYKIKSKSLASTSLKGAKVIPGNTGYSQYYYGIQLANTFQGFQLQRMLINL